MRWFKGWFKRHTWFEGYHEWLWNKDPLTLEVEWFGYTAKPLTIGFLFFYWGDWEMEAHLDLWRLKFSIYWR